jgi:hypothetical protein
MYRKKERGKVDGQHEGNRDKDTKNGGKVRGILGEEKMTKG